MYRIFVTSVAKANSILHRLPEDLAADIMFWDPRSQNMQLAYYAAAAATVKRVLKAFQRPLKPVLCFFILCVYDFICFYLFLCFLFVLFVFICVYLCFICFICFYVFLYGLICFDMFYMCLFVLSGFYLCVCVFISFYVFWYKHK